MAACDAGSKIREINTPQQDWKGCTRKPHVHADAHFILHLLPHSLSSTHTQFHIQEMRRRVKNGPGYLRDKGGFSCNLAGNQKASAGSGGCISSPNAESHSLPSLLDIKESFTKHLSFLKSHYAVLPCLIVSLLNLGSLKLALRFRSGKMIFSLFLALFIQLTSPLSAMK